VPEVFRLGGKKPFLIQIETPWKFRSNRAFS
jgi:hypothetical protein